MITDEARIILEAAAMTKAGDVRITRRLYKYILTSGAKNWDVDVDKFPSYLMMLVDLDKKGLLKLIGADIGARHGRISRDTHWYRISQKGRDYIAGLESGE